ncbi:Hypothetical predicted protein [Podarcis lilfordi]|uniref:Uncharacterized protein n=1 Tax=Podarcis lilfordi TaxID=74358 RepID=A0AA35P5R4_9SAUR|nr:Hypothetical predicted protein [Podarcis lilfordi]
MILSGCSEGGHSNTVSPLEKSSFFTDLTDLPCGIDFAALVLSKSPPHSGEARSSCRSQTGRRSFQAHEFTLQRDKEKDYAECGKAEGPRRPLSQSPHTEKKKLRICSFAALERISK